MVVYAENLGLPGEILAETVIPSPSRAWTGRFVGLAPVRREYQYEAILPQCFQVQRNIPYWIEISQVGDIQSRFRWESANGENFAVRFPIDTPYRLITNVGELAYELWTPEPCSGALLTLAFARLLKRRAR